jgi:GTPase SAR1 family protein
MVLLNILDTAGQEEYSVHAPLPVCVFCVQSPKAKRNVLTITCCTTIRTDLLVSIQAMRRTYMLSGHVFLLVYSATSLESFHALGEFYDQVRFCTPRIARASARHAPLCASLSSDRSTK